MTYAIEVERLSKKFKLHRGRRQTLKDRLLPWGSAKRPEEKWVLQDINLQLTPGSTVALIGKNGSGKSTLLKVISRILQPTTGSVRVNGKLATLLELGAGFHPEFTGRENIFLNGSILGFKRKEVQAKLERIVSFSELEHAIDNPLRTYSSGMYVRLGFAVAVQMEPDILLMDEVMAVGDYEFQKKCIAEVLRLKREGKTIVFVSHSGSEVKRVCDHAYWLDKGRIIMSGSAADIVDRYEGAGTT